MASLLATQIMSLIAQILNHHPHNQRNDQVLRSLFNDQELFKIPAFDVYEKEAEFVVKADVPGYTKDQLEIDVKDNILSIKGTWKKEESKENTDGFSHLKERAETSFQRSVTLGNRIDPKKIKAGLKEGVLEVRIPKTLQPEASRIAIE